MREQALRRFSSGFLLKTARLADFPGQCGLTIRKVYAWKNRAARIYGYYLSGEIRHESTH